MKIQKYHAITFTTNNSWDDPIKIIEKQGSRLSRKQAYNLAVTILREIESGKYCGTLTIDSDALLKIRNYETNNNKKPFEIAAGIEEKVLV